MSLRGQFIDLRKKTTSSSHLRVSQGQSTVERRNFRVSEISLTGGTGLARREMGKLCEARKVLIDRIW